MKKILYKRRFLFIPIGIVAFLALISYIVMQLWNHLLPQILNVSSITFWQAMGIFVLCKILFGFGKGGRWRHRRHCAKNSWQHIPDDEREKLRTAMKERMCFWKKEQEKPDDTSEQNI